MESNICIEKTIIFVEIILATNYFNTDFMVGKNEIIHTRKVTYIRKYLFVYTVNVRVNINININIPESIEIEEKSDEEFDWKKFRKKS